MATSFPTQQQQAAAYEQYVRANWNHLSAQEQEQARAYFQVAHPQVQPVKMAPGWTLAVGYVCCAIALLFIPILFAPAAFGFGVYNKKHGRPSQGTTLMTSSVACGIVGMILGIIVWSSM